MRSCFALAALVCLSIPAVMQAADEAPADTTFTVADGKMTFKAPAGWVKKMPRSRIVEVEFEIPAAKDDTAAGRLTMMGAGGEVQANIDRWVGQFKQEDGSDTKAKVEKLTVADCEVHYVDLSGTYMDNPAPFSGAKAIPRDNYRQLSVIILNKKVGNYFLKFYGPKATVAENEKAFRDLVGSLTVKE